MDVTNEIKGAVDEFVKQRVVKTVNFEKKRDHSAESLAKDHEKFLAAGEALKKQIDDVALPFLNVPLENSKDDGLQV